MKKIFFLSLLTLVLGPGMANATSDWQKMETLSSNPSTHSSIVTDSEGVIYTSFIEYDRTGTSIADYVVHDMWISIEKYEDGAVTSLQNIDLDGGYDDIKHAVNSSDELYISYYHEGGVYVQKYNGSSWDDVGNLGSYGVAIEDEYPVNLQFAIAPDDTVYLVYIDDANGGHTSDTPSTMIHAYTGNTSTDVDGNENDGWEYALWPYYSSIGEMQFDIDDNGEIYLIMNIAGDGECTTGSCTVEYNTSAYVLGESGWSSLLYGPFESTLNDYYMSANQDGFDLYAYGMELYRYTRSTDTWETLGNGSIENHYTSGNTGTQFARNSDNELFLIYGDTGTGSEYSSTVEMYDGSDWNTVGSSEFTEPSSMYYSIIFADDELYAVCREGEIGYMGLYKYTEGTATEAEETTTGSESDTNLTLSSLEIGDDPGNNPYTDLIKATVTNTGSANVSEFDITFWINGIREWHYSTATLPTAGATIAGGEFVITPQRLTETSTIKVCVDANETVTESDETDNCLEGVFSPDGAEESTSEDSASGPNFAEYTGDKGFSPVTGEEEDISTITKGQFIRSSSFNSIYFVDEDGKRRPFWDTNAFFSYADSFDEVSWVTDATLSTLEMGDPMLPQPGSVLVKIQSDPKVYAIDEGNVLRWVPDEDTANNVYGLSWADYVIDLDASTFARFSIGNNMATSDFVDKAMMKTRFQLSE